MRPGRPVRSISEIIDSDSEEELPPPPLGVVEEEDKMVVQRVKDGLGRTTETDL